MPSMLVTFYQFLREPCRALWNVDGERFAWRGTIAKSNDRVVVLNIDLKKKKKDEGIN